MALRADDVDLARDRSLVELAQGGDEAAFEDLYRRYYRRLYRYCVRRVGDPHDAEEVVQETFVRAVTALPRFAGERRFYPWLTVIAGRLCVDTHRRRARSEPSAEIDLGGFEPEHERGLIEEEDRQLVVQALDRLGPRHREVLHLREDLGLSYQAIADKYDVPIGTVEALLWRARKALKREYLAVAGVDARLAGLPVLGWAMRRWVSLRAKLEPIAHSAPIMAGGAAAGVVIVSSLFVPNGGGGGAPLDVQGPQTPAVAAAASADLPAPTEAVTVLATAASTASATGAASNNTAPKVRVGNVVLSGSQEDRQWAEDAPLTASLPVVGTVGADVEAGVDAALEQFGAGDR